MCVFKVGVLKDNIRAMFCHLQGDGKASIDCIVLFGEDQTDEGNSQRKKLE